MVFWHLDHIQVGFIFIVSVSEENAFWVYIWDVDMSEHLQYGGWEMVAMHYILSLLVLLFLS
jgi:hypothetical protein